MVEQGKSRRHANGDGRALPDARSFRVLREPGVPIDVDEVLRSSSLAQDYLLEGSLQVDLVGARFWCRTLKEDVGVSRAYEQLKFLASISHPLRQGPGPGNGRPPSSNEAEPRVTGSRLRTPKKLAAYGETGRL